MSVTPQVAHHPAPGIVDQLLAGVAGRLGTKTESRIRFGHQPTHFGIGTDASGYCSMASRKAKRLPSAE